MASTPLLCSVVLLAHDVNLSIFKSGWLTNCGVVQPSEIGDEFVFSPALVRVPTSTFELLFLPDRIQWRSAAQTDHSHEQIQRVIGKIAVLLPHTPFTAVGMNFEYAITPQDPSRKWFEALFGSKATTEMAPANEASVRFGSYVTMPLAGMRARVDIKPATVRATPENSPLSPNQQICQVHINFEHRFDEQPAVEQILHILNRWPEALKETKAIIERLDVDPR